MRWHWANMEFANAARLDRLSLKWDQDDPYEMLGAHVFLPGGLWVVVGGASGAVGGGCRSTSEASARV